MHAASRAQPKPVPAPARIGPAGPGSRLCEPRFGPDAAATDARRAPVRLRGAGPNAHVKPGPGLGARARRQAIRLSAAVIRVADGGWALAVAGGALARRRERGFLAGAAGRLSDRVSAIAKLMPAQPGPPPEDGVRPDSYCGAPRCRVLRPRRDRGPRRRHKLGFDSFLLKGVYSALSRSRHPGP